MATFVNTKIFSRMVVDYEPPEANFIADELFTVVPVQLPSGKYATFARHPSKLSDDEIAPRSGAGELDVIRIKSDATFSTVERGHKTLIHDRDKEVYGDFINIAKDAAYALKKQLLLNKEYSTAALLAATSNSTSPSVKWDASTGTIIIEKDIRDAIAAFESNAGVTPNTLVIPKQVWDAIVMDSTLREIWKLVPARSDQNIKLNSLLKLLFDNFSTVLVPNAKYDTTQKGKTESLTQIWTDSVYFLYTKPGVGSSQTFTWGSRFVYKNWSVKTWPNQEPEGTNLKVYYEEDRKEVCSTALYALTDVLT